MNKYRFSVNIEVSADTIEAARLVVSDEIGQLCDNDVFDWAELHHDGYYVGRADNDCLSN